MRLFRPVVAALAAAGLFILSVLPASALVLIEIDKSTQRMTVSQDGAQLYNWPVSTGLRSYDTPSGSFTPFRMEKDHYSREWDDAPMPHSIFFTARGHAIHGTDHKRNIGRPASHGCVRLERENARILFGLVKQAGMANTRVVLTGAVPSGNAPAVARRAPAYDQPGYDTRDDRPLYWQQSQPRPRGYYEDDMPYRRVLPPAPLPPRYVDPRYGLY